MLQVTERAVTTRGGTRGPGRAGGEGQCLCPWDLYLLRGSGGADGVLGGEAQRAGNQCWPLTPILCIFTVGPSAEGLLLVSNDPPAAAASSFFVMWWPGRGGSSSWNLELWARGRLPPAGRAPASEVQGPSHRFGKSEARENKLSHEIRGVGLKLASPGDSFKGFESGQ